VYLCALFLVATVAAVIHTISLHDALPIWIEHRFARQTPGAGRHTVQLAAADQRKRRVREFSVDFDYLLSLAITEHALRPADAPRSEEHTSELQSRENLVCRLLPEQKNMII